MSRWHQPPDSRPQRKQARRAESKLAGGVNHRSGVSHRRVQNEPRPGGAVERTGLGIAADELDAETTRDNGETYECGLHEVSTPGGFSDWKKVAGMRIRLP